MDLTQEIRARQIQAAEDAVIASIPQELRDRLRAADAEYALNGGCPGCDSKIIGVHYGDCTVSHLDCY